MEDYRELLYEVKGICMKIHTELGCGLLESVYQKVLAYELIKAGHLVMTEVPIPIYYDGKLIIKDAFRADLIIDNTLIVEIKSVDELHPVHHLQLATYIQLSGLPVGLLVNFRCTKLRDGMYTNTLDKLIEKYGSKSSIKR